jgi:hypothetical protein
MDVRRLELPKEIAVDNSSLELISVWHSNGKVKVMTREQTPLDDRVEIWSEIVTAIVKNIASHTAEHKGVSPDEVVEEIMNQLKSTMT